MKKNQTFEIEVRSELHRERAQVITGGLRLMMIQETCTVLHQCNDLEVLSVFV